MSILKNYSVKFPEHERAFQIINAERLPFSEAMIGETLPLSSYAIYRPQKGSVTVVEYIISGEGEIMINGEWHKAGAGDIYILAPGEEHRYRSNPKNPWHKLWINYSSDYMQSFISAYGVKTGVYKCAGAQEFFSEIFELSDSNLPESEICYLIAEKLHSVIAEVSREARCGVKENELRAAISRYIYKKLNLDAVADELHMSKSGLIRSFRRECGVTPYEYLLSLKIKSAKSLLRDTELPVYEIAERLAISDEHYFSAVFKKRTGIRPGAYRKKYRAQ